MTGLMLSMVSFIAGFKNKFESEKGATAVEYALMVALIAVAIIAAVTAVGTDLAQLFQQVVTAIPGGAA